MNGLMVVLDQLEAEATRVLESLEPTKPDHETITLLLEDLRATRARLSDARESTRAMIDLSVDQMTSAQQVLDRVIGVEPSDAGSATEALAEGS